MLKGKKALILITGAGSGLGADIAVALAQEVGQGSTLILHARSAEKLQKVRDDIENKVGKINVTIRSVHWDLRHPNSDQYEKDLNNALNGSKLEKYDLALIVHNAAALGDLKKKVQDFRNVQELQEQLNVNLVSLLALNAVWLELVKSVKKKIVVNMTAGSANTARASLGMTTMVKSSRQMTLKVLAAESPDVQVLNFDPGAVDTGSLQAIRDDSHSKEIRDWIKEFYDKNQVLSLEHMVGALVKTLEDGQYESGAYVNAYEVQL